MCGSKGIVELSDVVYLCVLYDVQKPLLQNKSRRRNDEAAVGSSILLVFGIFIASCSKLRVILQSPSEPTHLLLVPFLPSPLHSRPFLLLLPAVAPETFFRKDA